MRLLILGTGGMANAHARNFSAIEGVSIVGGVDVVPERLAAFCAEHGIERSFTSVEEALAWGEFDAVANVTPDRIHHPTTMLAIAAGKHVFCEKPLATDATLAMEMTEAIEASGKVGMVNFTYRNSPALQKGRQMVLDGAVGADALRALGKLRAGRPGIRYALGCRFGRSVRPRDRFRRISGASSGDAAPQLSEPQRSPSSPPMSASTDASISPSSPRSSAMPPSRPSTASSRPSRPATCSSRSISRRC